PFSPRRAWISPRSTVSPTPAFATTSPKRVVIPVSRRAGAAGSPDPAVAAAAAPSSTLLLLAALHGPQLGRRLELAGGELLPDLLELRLQLVAALARAELEVRDLGVVDAVAPALGVALDHAL